MTAAEPEIANDAHAPAWRAPLRGIRAAFVTLTRLPVGGFPYSMDEWRWSSAHLPFAGACLGGVLCGVWLTLARAGDNVAAIVTVIVSLLLTGAMHEDGLADSADAFGAGQGDRARILVIMKDSRVGTYGAAALALSVMLRVALLVRLGTAAPAALVLAESASRVVPVWLMTRLPYVTDPASQKSAAISHTGRPQLLVAVASGLVLSVASGWWVFPSPWEAVVIVGVVASASWGGEAYLRRRLGGFTGDTLGAAQQITWLVLLCAFVLARGESL